MDCCYIDFSPVKVEGLKTEIVKAVAISVETARGETLVMDLTADGKIIGIDIFAPGLKPCQPAWAHVVEEVIQ